MRITLFFAFVVIVSSCKLNNSNADKPAEQLLDSVYTINGILNGADSTTVVVMNFLGAERKPDTATVIGNKFEFKGKADDALVAEIHIQQESHEPVKGLKLVVENSVINIEGNKDSFYNATVIGGISNNEFNTLKQTLRVYEDSMESVALSGQEAELAQDSALNTKLHEQHFQLEKEKGATIKQFVFEHPKNIAGAYYVTTQYNYSNVELDSIYSAFDSTIQNNLYVKQIKELVDAFKRTAIGQTAPDFTMNSTNGNPVTLSTLKGKYLLVDFWASWCAPCRAENPNIVKAYQKFKTKEFEVLGVSLDDNKQDWLQAIQKDKLTWKHTSDLKGWGSIVVPLYGIRGIPTNLLLDKDGKIIARDLHGDQLHKKLEEVLTKSL